MQAALAARRVMQRFYQGQYKADDEMAPCMGRDIQLAVSHPRLGVCAPGACPPEVQCLGPMEPVVPEATAYLQLSHIVRQLDVPSAAAQLPDSAEAAVRHKLDLTEPMLRQAHECTLQLLQSAEYHWVSMSALLGSLCVLS
jgi:DNA Polymerase alpha zinc finger